MTAPRTSRRGLLKALGLGAASTLAARRGARAAAAPRAKKPNIILVLADDVGWTDTSVRMLAARADSRSDFYRTPALARLAQEGMVFSNAYAASPVCTPSRASLQFGKTPARLRQTVVHDVLARRRGIDCKDEVSIARMVKAADASYVTGHLGKWGFPPRPPDHAGYDVTDGNTNNAHGDWLDRPGDKPLPADDPKRIFSLTRRANAFMARCAAAGRPFFLQVSHYALHVRHAALPATLAKWKRRPRGGKCTPADCADPPPAPNAWGLLYAAMIEDLDTALGMLLAKLDELGLAASTYVLFTADNGGGFRGCGPLRGGKASLWEGGIRVPTVVRGPAVKAGCHCDVPVAAWDLLPTVSDLIGNTRPPPADLDGGSLRGLFEKANAGEVKRPGEGLIFHFPWYENVPTSAIRLGDYKLIKDLNTGEVRLFNLADDLGESKDLSKALPAKADELHRKLTRYLEAVGAETVGDMRSARRKELLGYAARDEREIAELARRAAEAAGDERAKLQATLRDRRRRLKAHAAALGRLDRARKMTAW